MVLIIKIEEPLATVLRTIASSVRERYPSGKLEDGTTTSTSDTVEAVVEMALIREFVDFRDANIATAAIEAYRQHTLAVTPQGGKYPHGGYCIESMEVE